MLIYTMFPNPITYRGFTQVELGACGVLVYRLYQKLFGYVFLLFLCHSGGLLEAMAYLWLWTVKHILLTVYCVGLCRSVLLHAFVRPVCSVAFPLLSCSTVS